MRILSFPGIGRAALLLVLLGCEGGSSLAPEDYELPPGAPAPVVLDSATYTLRATSWGLEGSAQVSYTNHTGHPVYFSRCMPQYDVPIPSLQRVGPDNTLPVFVGGIPACVGGVRPGIIFPGKSVAMSVYLGSSDSPNANPPIELAWRTGTFRLVVGLCTAAHTGPDECEPLPLASRVSDPFEVIAPAP